jgi:hypothetical protein
MRKQPLDDEARMHAAIDGAARGSWRDRRPAPPEQGLKAEAYSRHRDQLAAFADLALRDAPERVADHLFDQLAHRARRRLAGAWAARAGACLALLAFGFIGGVVAPRLANAPPPSYALAVEGSHLILDGGNLQTVRRVSDLGSPAQAERMVSQWLHLHARTPAFKGYRLTEVVLMQADRLPVAGLLYRSTSGRALTVSLSQDPDGLPDPYFTFVSHGRKASYWSDGRDSYGVLEDHL